MAQNESMEGKDLARQERIKQNFEDMIMDIPSSKTYLCVRAGGSKASGI